MTVPGYRSTAPIYAIHCPQCGGRTLRERSRVTVWGHVAGLGPEGLVWDDCGIREDYAQTGDLHCTECAFAWHITPETEYRILRDRAAG